MARRRRKVFVDANNHDRWIVSYADFITLLFAFFVVMYAMSSVNEGKYKSLTQSLGTAFSKNDLHPSQPITPGKTEPVLIKPPSIPLEVAFEFKPSPQANSIEEAEDWRLNPVPLTSQGPTQDQTDKSATDSKQPPSPVPLGIAFDSTQPSHPETPLSENNHESNPTLPPVDVGQSTLMEIFTLPFKSASQDQSNVPETEEKRELSTEILKERRHLNEVSDQLEQALGSFIGDNLVAVKRNDYWIELEMNSELLFLSGDAALSKKAQPVLKEIVQVINTLPNAINVEGHTDNIPISNLKYPSNWDLSSARATSVVQELVKEGVDPIRLSAVGYGQFHPLGDNMTDEGRFKNRRVTLVLMSQAFARYGTNDTERAKLLNLKPTVEHTGATVTEP